MSGFLAYAGGIPFYFFLQSDNEMIYNGTYTTLYPTDLEVDSGLQDAIATHFKYRSVLWSDPQIFLERFHDLVTRRLDSWNSLLGLKSITFDDFIESYYLKETVTGNTSNTSSTSSQSSNSTSVDNSSSNVSYQSDTPDGSVDDIKTYMSAAAVTDITASSATSASTNGSGSTDASTTGSTETIRQGRLGNYSYSTLIKNYKAFLRDDPYNYIFNEIEPLFTQVYLHMEGWVKA